MEPKLNVDKESGELRALRSKNVLTCQRAFRAYMLTSQRVICAHVLTCQRALRARMHFVQYFHASFWVHHILSKTFASFRLVNCGNLKILFESVKHL